MHFLPFQPWHDNWGVRHVHSRPAVRMVRAWFARQPIRGWYGFSIVLGV